MSKRHIDPHSHAVLLRSEDGGHSFSAELLHEEPYEGVQDPCLNRLRDGTLLLTFFTWSIQQTAYSTPLEEAGLWVDLDGKHQARIGGLYSIRSTDGGHTWDAPVVIDAGPRALRGKGVELPGGGFLSAAYQRNGVVTLYRTDDHGLHWEALADLTHPLGVSETSLLLTGEGKVVAFMRSRGGEYPLITAESHDLGRTWGPLVERPFFSHSPFEPVRLRNGKVLVTYGHRREPFGIRAVLLDGECEAWGPEITLREGALGGDIGYTTTVELPNGELLVFYYIYGEDGYRQIEVTRCRFA